MLIDDITYKLLPNNYIPVECEKKLIILSHTFNNNMRHFIGWQNRYNGIYKKTAAFTISKSGLIYKHFDAKFYSRFLKNHDLNSKSIIILLENDGWLVKDNEKDEFLTWIGDIYKQPSEVIEKRWRGYTFWDPYTKEQLDSVVKLVKKLCKDFNIPFKVIGHNTKIDKFNEYQGVLYKSNIEKFYSDLNPSWSFELFKNKIEEKEII